MKNIAIVFLIKIINKCRLDLSCNTIDSTKVLWRTFFGYWTIWRAHCRKDMQTNDFKTWWGRSHHWDVASRQSCEMSIYLHWAKHSTQILPQEKRVNRDNFNSEFEQKILKKILFEDKCWRLFQIRQFCTHNFPQLHIMILPSFYPNLPFFTRIYPLFENVYEGLNARSKVYLFEVYFLRNVPDLRVFEALRVYS